MQVRAAPPLSIGSTASRPVSAETRHSAALDLASVIGSDERISDWQTFCASYFPNRRRHDLEALVAYAAYRRHAPGTKPMETARQLSEGSLTGPSPLQVWEDEGGAAS
jgi:hypothetical protein